MNEILELPDTAEELHVFRVTKDALYTQDPETGATYKFSLRHAREGKRGRPRKSIDTVHLNVRLTELICKKLKQYIQYTRLQGDPKRLSIVVCDALYYMIFWRIKKSVFCPQYITKEKHRKMVGGRMTKQVNLMLPKGVAQQVWDLSLKHNTTCTAIVEYALRTYLHGMLTRIHLGAEQRNVTEANAD